MERKLKSVKRRSSHKIKRKSKSIKRLSTRSKRRPRRSKDNGLSKFLKNFKNHEDKKVFSSVLNSQLSPHSLQAENIKKILKILEKIDPVKNKRQYTPRSRSRSMSRSRPDYLSYYAAEDPDEYMEFIKQIPTTTTIPTSANLV